MAPYFSEPHHIEFFSLGFDLIRDQLPELMIADILTGIEENLEEYPEDRSAVLALDALYDAIDDRVCAIGTDSAYTFLTDSSLFTLREARHQVLNADPERSEQLLKEVIRRDSADSSVRQLCALIAYGRMNDRKNFTTMWNRLLRQYGTGEQMSKRGISDQPEYYSLFGELPFREHIEGIGFLYAFDIRQGREAEVLALVTGFRHYLNNLSEMMFAEAVVDGFTDSLPAFRVIAAISSGMVKASAEVLAMGDSISRVAMSRAIHPALEEIRETGREMLVLDTLKHWSFNPVPPSPDLISTLQEQSGWDNELIEGILDLLNADRPQMNYDEIRSGIPVSIRKEHDLRWEELEQMRNEFRFCDALAFAGQHALITPGSEEFEDLNVHALLESGREDDAFEYLLGRMKTGHLLTWDNRLFELACTLNRMDDLLVIRPVLETGKITAGTYLLDAYGRMMNKDVKGGLALIERAERSGLSGDDALLVSARFLLDSGFPKRVPGICEKMARRGIPDVKSYPLLIQAYRDLGREDDALAAEELLRQILSRRVRG